MEAPRRNWRCFLSADPPGSQAAAYACLRLCCITQDTDPSIRPPLFPMTSPVPVLLCKGFLIVPDSSVATQRQSASDNAIPSLDAYDGSCNMRSLDAQVSQRSPLQASKPTPAPNHLSLLIPAPPISARLSPIISSLLSGVPVLRLELVAGNPFPDLRARILRRFRVRCLSPALPERSTVFLGFAPALTCTVIRPFFWWSLA